MINRLSRALAGAALLALGTPQAIAADDTWTKDFAAAKVTAADAGKDLLLYFTNHPLDHFFREVFSNDAFLTAVPKHFVLVKLDLPDENGGLAGKNQEQNDALARYYEVNSPRIILADADGRPYALGSFIEEPGEFVADLNVLRERRIRRDAAFASAAKAEGMEKAKWLVAGLDTMSKDFRIKGFDHYYGDIVAEIKANDPEDETGFAQRAVANARFNEVKKQFKALFAEEKYEEALQQLDAIQAIQGLSLQQKQSLTIARCGVFEQLGQYDNAIKALDEAIDESTQIDPESEMILKFRQLKTIYIQTRDAR